MLHRKLSVLLSDTWYFIPLSMGPFPCNKTLFYFFIVSNERFNSLTICYRKKLYLFLLINTPRGVMDYVHDNKFLTQSIPLPK